MRMHSLLFLEFDFPFLPSPPLPCCRFKVHRHVSVCVKLMCRATVRWPSCECWEEWEGEKEGEGRRSGRRRGQEGRGRGERRGGGG